MVQVLPITVYNSDFVLALRRQIAVSDRFICYALKQGHIRVLSTQSAHRSLVKAHKPPLTDMQCACPPSPELRCARFAAPRSMRLGGDPLSALLIGVCDASQRCWAPLTQVTRGLAVLAD